MKRYWRLSTKFQAKIQVKPNRIILKGYYGAGNIGDDLLMISAYKILKELFPEDKIYVDTKSGYYKILIPDAVKFTESKINSSDLIFYGGGGLFFDFQKGDIKHLLLNSAVNLLNIKRFIYLFSWVRPKIKQEHEQKIISFGLGVGPYPYSSKKYIRHLVLFNKMEFISVRDEMSHSILRKAGVPAFIHTDLVFNREAFPFFKEIEQQKEKKDGKPSIGIILRDWRFEENNISKYIQFYNENKDKFDIQFLVFNPTNDTGIIEQLKNSKISPILYNPRDLIPFLQIMKTQDIIITQRAHGAIIANQLNVPAICIGIEPKLKNVHRMLPNSTLYLDKDFDLNDLNIILVDKKKIDALRKATKSDAENNYKKVLQLKRDLSNFLNTNLKK